MGRLKVRGHCGIGFLPRLVDERSVWQKVWGCWAIGRGIVWVWLCCAIDLRCLIEEPPPYTLP